MQSNAEYQRRKAMGYDARVREGIDIQAKCIHERDCYNNPTASYERARERAVKNFERMDRKRG